MDIKDIKDAFEPFDRLVEIEICGRKHEVPENNTLLRCFQFLSIETISYGDFCWNGDCLNCQVGIENGDKIKNAIACRTRVEDGMKIVSLSKDVVIDEAE